MLVELLICFILTHVTSIEALYQSKSASKFSQRQKILQQKFTPADFDITLYDLQLQLSSSLAKGLTSFSLVYAGSILGAGLLSALSPCSLGLLPISISYLSQDVKQETATSVSIVRSSTESQGSGLTSSLSTSISDQKTISFVVGSLLAFASLGSSAALVGGLVGSGFEGFNGLKDLALASLYIVMGLSLSEVLTINFASLIKTDGLTKKATQYSANLQALVLGASSSLVGSSCTTPVLSSLLALIASYGNVTSGAFLLSFYGIGYLLPLLSAKYLIKGFKFSELGGKVQWINQFFACLLLIYGSYLAVNLFFTLGE